MPPTELVEGTELIVGTELIEGAELIEGCVAWASMEPVRDREQGGHRPVVVVASAGYLETATTLAIVVPVTSRDRGWPNHVALTGRTGLPGDSWAMSEQPRTLSRDRITRVVGMVDGESLARIRLHLRDYLGL